MRTKITYLDTAMTDDGKLFLYQRLEAFKLRHKLTDEIMAGALGTRVRTYRHWKYDKNTPPAAVAQLLALFEKYPDIRIKAGAFRQKRRRGGFKKRNPWRLTPERGRALAEKRWRNG